jgi:hypothetical protein
MGCATSSWGRVAVLIGELAHRTERPVSEGELAAIVIKPRNTARCIIRPASRPLARPEASPSGQRGRKPHGWAALAREHEVLARLSRNVPGAGFAPTAVLP